ncbi:transcriptional regulator [Alishewanella longhuensis]
MCLSHPAIGKGKEITVHGCSALRWQDDQIIYHRDYYDLTEMVYQHIPVVSWLTGKVPKRWLISN